MLLLLAGCDLFNQSEVTSTIPFPVDVEFRVIGSSDSSIVLFPEGDTYNQFLDSLRPYEPGPFQPAYREYTPWAFSIEVTEHELTLFCARRVQGDITAEVWVNGELYETASINRNGATNCIMPWLINPSPQIRYTIHSSCTTDIDSASVTLATPGGPEVLQASDYLTFDEDGTVNAVDIKKIYNVNPGFKASIQLPQQLSFRPFPLDAPNCGTHVWINMPNGDELILLAYYVYLSGFPPSPPVITATVPGRF